MSERIAAAFRGARSAGRPAFIPFITAGDPDLAATRAIVFALARAGADVIEIGVPFSDPIADGIVLQRAAERALRGGTTLARILDLVGDLRREGSPPLVLFTYFNPIHRLGMETFALRAEAAEVNGVLITDLPPEEAQAMRQSLDPRHIDRIGFVAPTSTPARIRMIAADSGGFLYVISRAGVTGARADLPPGLAEQVAGVRAAAGSLPIAVGFGISSREQMRAIAAFADGVVVGSALAKVIEEAGARADLPRQVEQFCRTLLW